MTPCTGNRVNSNCDRIPLEPTFELNPHNLNDTRRLLLCPTQMLA